MGRCSTKIRDRKYKGKSCELCGSVFTPTHPAKKYCCEECRDIARERKHKKRYMMNYRYQKRRIHFCELCGKPLDDGRQYVHFSCMVKRLRKGTPGSWTEKEKRYFYSKGYSRAEISALVKGEMNL